jgi:pSer/pThr/pTyr-binding forkhead associated (FHA) protein
VALTILVVSTPPRPGASGAEVDQASLSFDTPRLVIGRGDGCDLRLPDPSVSHRHCSIRQRGAEHVVVDEGSTNGTFVGRSRLTPQSPQGLRSGDFVRIGRIWLEVRIEAAIVAASPAAAAKAVAIRLVTAGLAANGEDGRPRVKVVDGPDAGKELVLDEPGRRYIIGRSKDVDLVLDDESASRRHVDVEVVADHVVVHDLGSKSGASIEGSPAVLTGTPWRPGQSLTIGSNRMTLDYGALEALAELERSPDERIPKDEVFEVPAGAAAEEAPLGGSAETVADIDEPPQTSLATEDETPSPDPGLDRGTAFASGRRFGLTDAIVILFALGILVASAAGLWLLLRG